MVGAPFEARDLVRVGFVGVGGRGFGQLREVLAVQGVQVTAISDLSEEARARAEQAVIDKGQPAPAVEEDWRRVCDRDDVDIVYVCTSWESHVPIAVQAMECDKHAAIEVPAAVTLAECWQMVDTSERTRKHCVILENCCYCHAEMLVLNMVREGLFGTLTHGEAAYIHDLRDYLLSDKGEGLWRRFPHIDRNGNHYPTHGLGPVAWYMNINRGDRFDFLVSMSCNSRGLQAYAAESFPVDDPRRKEKYVLGDVNSSLIRTVNGRSILLQHDTNLPRPYSRLNTIQGTKGIFRGFPDQIHIDGRTKGHDWEPLDEYRKEFEHPLWKAMQEKAVGAGHGGMDFIEDYRLIHALRTGTAPDMDVYDAAAWSAISELTERSVANRSRSMDVPDFTRGQWKTNPPLGIIQG